MSSIDKGKQEALNKAMEQIHKDYGKGSIMRMGDRKVDDVPAISTGILPLDIALGVNGIPRGRVIEIYGPESSGKTSLTLNIIGEAQKAGGLAAFIDAEHAMDPIYAKKLGVDIDNLLVSQPDCGEDALQICETLVRSGSLDIIVIDSVAALTPKAEIEGEMGDSHMGLQARLMSQALRKLTAIINQTKTTVIFINQIRMKIGVMFGNPETTTGGNALKFYASVRMDVRKKETIKDGDDPIGNLVKVKIVKNKVAPPFKSAEFVINFTRGISKEEGIFDMAVERNIIVKGGAWYSYNDQKLGQGRENALQTMMSDKAMTKEILNKVLNVGIVAIDIPKSQIEDADVITQHMLLPQDEEPKKLKKKVKDE